MDRQAPITKEELLSLAQSRDLSIMGYLMLTGLGSTDIVPDVKQNFVTHKDFMDARTYVRDSGGYYCIPTYPKIEGSIDIVKDVIIHILSSHIDNDMNIDIYCTQDVRVKLLQHFWKQDFNYLGTRIKLKITEDYQPQNLDDYKLLFVVDGTPVGYIESA